MVIAVKFIRVLHKISPIQRALLFGSTARSMDKWESDIDIYLVVSRRLMSKENEKLNESVTEILLHSGIIINWISFVNEEWDADAHPIVQTIIKRGRIYGRERKPTRNRTPVLRESTLEIRECKYPSSEKAR